MTARTGQGFIQVKQVTVRNDQYAFDQAQRLLGQLHPQAIGLIENAIAITQNDFPEDGLEAVVNMDRLSQLIRRDPGWPPPNQQGYMGPATVDDECNAPILMWIDAPESVENRRKLELVRQRVDGTVVDVSLRPGPARRHMARDVLNGLIID